LLGNVSSNYLISGEEAQRYANGHPNIVPYQSFRTLDGYIVVTCGNDHLYQRLCQILDRPDLADDARFSTNPLRIHNRDALVPQLQDCFRQRKSEDWLADLRAAGIPCSPINTVSQVFHDPQIQARNFVWECDHPTAGKIHLSGSPLHLMDTPPRLYKAPPLLGEDNAMLEKLD
ncbi:MAG TPA: CoA transferase, partial [Ktedonobacteraceae bacterium]|nr:CoA transferase [Ktedonobacteraceae bacterium]